MEERKEKIEQLHNCMGENLPQIAFAAMDYVEDRAEKAYVFISYHKGEGESWTVSCDFFFKHNGRIVEKTELNTVISSREPEFDISPQFQMEIMTDICNYMAEVIVAFKNAGEQIPDITKLVINIQTQGMDTNYEYDVFGESSENMSKTLFKKWMEEVRAKEEN